MRLLSLLLLLPVGFAWLTGNTAHGAAHHSLDAIRSSVEEFLQSRRDPQASETRVHVSALDTRLRLPQCTGPLAPFVPSGRGSSANVTVGVRCTGDKPWTVYVPARIETFIKVAVLRSPVARGAVVEAADVDLDDRDVGKLRDGYFTEAAQVVGMVARRPLRSGATIRANMLTPPTLIRRGERVTLIVGDGALRVRAEGRALNDGARGQLIGVRNTRSNRVIEGVVVSAGVVEIRL